MTRDGLAVLGVLVVVTLLTGCEQGMISENTSEQRVAAERERNVQLQSEITNLNNDNARLKLDLANTERDLGTVKLEAESWKKKHEAARALLEAGTGTQGLPPELLQKFIEIARGPWELAGGARLKASSDILFDAGKATLKVEGQNALRDIAAKLKEILTDRRVMLRIDGHTDNQPIRYSDWKDNMELSLARARAVWVFLRDQGIPGQTMGAMGFGEFHPIALNDTKEDQGRNRRVELSLISIAPAAPTTP